MENYSPNLYAKLEWYNPFGSVKDRAAKCMIQRAEKEGKSRRGYTKLIEPSSGNTGIALAGIATSLGYSMEVVVSKRISEETKIKIRSLGAKLLEVDDDLCPRVGPRDQAITLANAIVRNHPDEYVMLNQYENQANIQAHYESTGPEIWRDTKGEVKNLALTVGTGGTIAGVSKYLKEKNPRIEVYAVVPERDHHLQGLRNFDESATPQILKQSLEENPNLIDGWITVSDKDAFATVREVAEKEKLAVGSSSGAALYAANSVVNGNGMTVTIFPDDARKYKSVYMELNVFTSEEFESLLRNGGNSCACKNRCDNCCRYKSNELQKRINRSLTLQ